MIRRASLLGRRFGYLEVIARATPGMERSAWVCVCHCGVQVEILFQDLLAGRAMSCGFGCTPGQSRKPWDLSDQRFSTFTAIKPTGWKGREILWLARCDCGAEEVLSSKRLKALDPGPCGHHGRQEVTA